MRPPAPIYQVLFTVALLALGAGSIYWGGLLYRQAEASQSWPSVDGLIVWSEIKENHDRVNVLTYDAAVEFAYKVDGKRYTSKHTRNSSSSEVREVVNRYPAGKPVKVFYDPQRPDFGVLEPGVNADNYVVFVAGFAFLLAGLVMAVATGYRIRALKRP